jgi:hypothetical protein
MLLPTLLAACGSDTGVTAQRRELESFPMVDAGAVAPEDRQSFTVPLFSQGPGAVTVFAIEAEDLSVPEGFTGSAFLSEPADWASGCDGDGDGVDDCVVIEGFDDSSDVDTLALTARFAPTVPGYYEGQLTIYSNDTVSQEHAPLPDDPEQEATVWRVQLRGLSDYPCGRAWPSFIDFGRKAAGGNFSEAIHIENCGIVRLDVASIQVENTVSMSSLTLTPLYVLAGSSQDVTIGWSVGAETDGLETPEGATVRFVSNAESLDEHTVTIIGNDCDQSVSTDWDEDNDGWFLCGGDCDDTDASISPSDVEIPDDGLDNDCDDETDESANPQGSDDDGDGCSETGAEDACLGSYDCDDADPDINPAAQEVEDRVDNDCDGKWDEGTDAYDDDGDGYSEREGDCDDTNILVSPAAAETVDGVDSDCDGIVDEGGGTYDDDGDGYADYDEVADDCDDYDPWVFVGAFEYCDGYDNDCDLKVDEGPADEPDGACTFLPAQLQPDDTGVAGPGGCSSAPAVGSAAAVAGLLAVGLSRRWR